MSESIPPVEEKLSLELSADDFEGATKDDEAHPGVLRRAARTAGKVLMVIGLSTTASAAEIYIENPDLREIAEGVLFDNPENLYPIIPGCPRVEYQPPTFAADSTTTTTEQPKPTDEADQAPPSSTTTALDTFEDKVHERDSSAIENSLFGLNPFSLKNQYNSFFENFTGSYTSPISGLQYDFYSYGDNTPAIYSPDTIDQMMYRPFHDEMSYGKEGLQELVDCAERLIFEEGVFRDKKVAIVIPTEPNTCAGDFTIIQYPNSPEPESCKQQGMTLPSHELSVFGIDQKNNDYDTVIFLSSEGGNTHRATRITLHDMTGHALFMLLGDDFGLSTDERAAWLFQRHVERNPAVSPLPERPPFYYVES